MTEFTQVLGSVPMDAGLEGAVRRECVRTLLGLTCIKGQYECLCQHVASSEVYAQRNDRGETAIFSLEMDLIPQVGKPQAVMTGIELTGYVADLRASNSTVSASFRMTKPQNSALRDYVRDSGV